MSTPFEIENARRWSEALKATFPKNVPASAAWTDPREMVHVLSPFCGQAVNHTMLPRSGGMDILKISYDDAKGLIELWPNARVAYVARPQTLEFRHVEASPVDSFFMLTNASLDPSGVYEDFTGNYEEILELPDGEQMDRSHLDLGYIGHTENGEEIPLPDEYRLVCRYLDGKFLMVAKSSLWNRVTATYDGRHNKLSADEIQKQLADALAKYKQRKEDGSK